MCPADGAEAGEKAGFRKNFGISLYGKYCLQVYYTKRIVFEVSVLNAEFSRTLSLLRQEKGVSQRTAAGALGISQALLSHYENGIREPGLAFVAKVCDYYQVSADYLLGRTPDRTCPQGTVGSSRHDSALLMRTADALSQACAEACREEPELGLLFRRLSGQLSKDLGKSPNR